MEPSKVKKITTRKGKEVDHLFRHDKVKMVAMSLATDGNIFRHTIEFAFLRISDIFIYTNTS
jgi:hypothetical protein